MSNTNRRAFNETLLVNEVLASPTGIDPEFFELYGTPGAPLDPGLFVRPAR